MIESARDPLLTAVVVALLGFMIGLTKGGLSGLGALLTPMLSLVLPDVALAVGVLLPMLIVGDAFAVYAYRGEWDGRLVRGLLPGAIAGVVIGTLLLTNLPANVARIVLGIFTLIVVAYKFVSDSIQNVRYQPRVWHAPVVGALSGCASGLFNIGGPPFNAYLLLQGLSPRSFAATTAIFFAALNLIKVPGFLIAGVIDLPLLLSLGWVFPFIPLGNWIARALVVRLNQRAFEWIVVVLLMLSSGLLLWQSR